MILDENNVIVPHMDKMVNKRPVYITIISLIIIITGLIFLFFSLFIQFVDLGLGRITTTAMLWLIPYSIFIIVIGIAMLKGKRWSRIAVILNGIIMIVNRFIDSMHYLSFNALISIMIFIVIAILLYRPRANLFFNPKNKNLRNDYNKGDGHI